MTDFPNASPACGAASPGGSLCGFAPHAAGLHSWEGLVRKGALAADRMSRDPDVAVVCDDLARLADFGALGGVAEIIRERLRQVQDLGHTVARDAERHAEGFLPVSATLHLEAMWNAEREGTAGYPECEQELRQAGALLAAEIDRLVHDLTPEAGS